MIQKCCIISKKIVKNKIKRKLKEIQQVFKLRKVKLANVKKKLELSF